MSPQLLQKARKGAQGGPKPAGEDNGRAPAEIGGYRFPSVPGNWKAHSSLPSTLLGEGLSQRTECGGFRSMPVWLTACTDEINFN